MIEGHWNPQNDEEWELIEKLHVATREAANDDVSKVRIASCLAFMAAAASDSYLEDGDKPPVAEPDENVVESLSCPLCETEIEEVRATGVGLEPFILDPCGHDLSEEFPFEEIQKIYDEIRRREG